MEKDIERLFDLISSKAYSELTKEENQFVHEHMTQEEYELQRTIIAATDELEYPVAVPLVLEEKAEVIPILKRSIPLYQALIGAACLIVGFFLFSGKSRLDLQFDSSFIDFQFENPNHLVDVVHDTVFKEVGSARTAANSSKPKVDTVYIVQPAGYVPNTRMLDPGIGSVSAVLDEKPKQSVGISSRKDKTTNLLPSTQTYTSMK
jgi:hypothetical protein